MIIPPQDCASTLSADNESETRVKGSRFLARAARAGQRLDAENIVRLEEKKYHDATHHCWAWLALDDPPSGFFRDDDGEPSGSAGRPIQQTIESAGLVGVVVVVTRWFGGTKLGVGGLARAYAQAAGLALGGARTLTGIRAETYGLTFDYSLFGKVNQVLENEPVVITRRDFGPAVGLNIAVARSRADTLCRALVETVAGRIELASLGARTVFPGEDY